ncbi:hypothetical protein ACFW9L_16415 [Streptomyces sp. NPDC059517]|uniref:hypothetical protein n=1 Tax=Streptomyces sp. NPDC059517 TaxID=3346855 RepID=UPI003678CF23
MQTTARTYRFVRCGQITDRFTKAIGRLDSGQICVRIGVGRPRTQCLGPEAPVVSRRRD